MTAGHVVLSAWERAGLLHPSLLRLAKIATVDASLIERSIGRLTTEDLRVTRAAFQKHFAAWLA